MEQLQISNAVVVSVSTVFPQHATYHLKVRILFVVRP